MIIKSLEHLKIISKKIADNVSKRDCISLVGEICVGKTTFTRHFINYLQKKEGVEETEVLSPTFNLLYEYDIKNFKVMHYDLYRIKNKNEINQLGIFKNRLDSINIIEWPELLKINENNKLELHLKYSKNENERELRVRGFGRWKNINENEL